jgi:hypothetical protein
MDYKYANTNRSKTSIRKECASNIIVNGVYFYDKYDQLPNGKIIGQYDVNTIPAHYLKV